MVLEIVIKNNQEGLNEKKACLCLFIATILCVSFFMAFAAEEMTKEGIVSTEETVDNTAEALVVRVEKISETVTDENGKVY